jgi:hypothetical protein
MAFKDKKSWGVEGSSLGERLIRPERHLAHSDSASQKLLPTLTKALRIGAQACANALTGAGEAAVFCGRWRRCSAGKSAKEVFAATPAAGPVVPWH